MRLYGLLAALLISGLARADAVRWYVLEMQGQRAGWMVERETVDGDTIVTTSESSLTIRRGETAISISMGSEFIETRDGLPIEMTATANMGSAPSTDRYVFEDDGVIWTSSQQGKMVSKTLPLPEGRWLPPAAAGRYTAKRLEAGADEIVVRTIDPTNGLEPILTTRTGFSEVTIEVLGRSVKAMRCRSLSSLYPEAEGVEFIDRNGNLLRSELKLGAVTITVIAADEELAKAELDPPELMRSMFIKPDRAIRDAYSKASGTFIVRATTGTLPELPSSGSQAVEVIDNSTVRVRRVVSALGEPVLGTDVKLLTSPSAMLDSDDPRVVELTRSALLGGPDDQMSRAEITRRFVHRYIRTKDLSVGFASAGETARTREGDCTEHGVLLAAMLRADGIPSRVVSGLIYAERFAGGRDIFGYHMWAQALIEIDGALRWVDLDATLPDSTPMTATHIALGVHTLEGASRANALVELAPMMGRLAITVEKME